MKTTFTKNEKALIGIILVAVVTCGAMFSQVDLKQKSLSGFAENEVINYKMGRPVSEGYSEYSLTGRDIDHVYEGLPAKKPAVVKAEVTAAKATAAKMAEAKKKQEAAKKAQASAAKGTGPVNVTAKTAEAKKASDSLKTSANESEHHSDNSNSNANTNSAAAATPEQAAPVPPDAETIDKNKKTFAQWRALIYATPTRETLALFIDAYRKNQVTATEYQAMSQDLLDQTDEKYKGLGILALRAQPSLQSLSQLSHLSTTTLSASMQTYLNQALLAYLQPQNVAILNQALQTKDKTLITKSLTMLNTNLPKINQGDYSGLSDSRNVRDTASNNYSASSFKVLLPSLSALSTSGDSQLASLAQQTTNYIQSSGTVAQN